MLYGEEITLTLELIQGELESGPLPHPARSDAE
jgi:hypothetical protein